MIGTQRGRATRTPRRIHRPIAVAVSVCAVTALAACGTGAPPDTAPPAQDEAGVEFSDGFESGNPNAWGLIEPADGRIEVVSDPVRTGNFAVRLTASQDDVGEGENVRTQLNGPELFEDGDEAYVGWSTYLPPDLQDIPPDVWFTFFEFHGEPFDGSPLPGTLDITNRGGEQYLAFTRSEQYDYDRPWSMPLVKGQWIDFVMHVGFSHDESAGFVELWVNGEQQTFADGSTRLQQATMMDGQDVLFPIATNYYKADSIDGEMTVFHDNIRVADSLELASAPALAPAAAMPQTSGNSDSGSNDGDNPDGGDDGGGDGDDGSDDGN